MVMGDQCASNVKATAKALSESNSDKCRKAFVIERFGSSIVAVAQEGIELFGPVQ